MVINPSTRSSSEVTQNNQNPPPTSSETIQNNQNPHPSSTETIQTNRNPLPQWLRLWLDIEFHNQGKCKKHTKYKMVFCRVCKEEPVCESCWKDSEGAHKNHPYLQVCMASRRVGIDIDNIKEICDISKIQQYKINGKAIVYLKPNTGGNMGGPGEKKDDFPKCEMCSKKLIESKYNFCSIACKVTPKLPPVLEVIPELPPVLEETPKLSFRKRPRKSSCPQRAPLK